MRFYFEMHGRAWPFSNWELFGGILIIVFDPQMRPCSELGQSFIGRTEFIFMVTRQLPMRATIQFCHYISFCIAA